MITTLMVTDAIVASGERVMITMARASASEITFMPLN